jgi:predicted SprT family Zn-dependent metalloprotease
MNLTDAKKLARSLMDEHGANDIPLVISGGKTQLGVCCWNPVKKGLNKEDFSDDLTAQIFGYRPRRRRRRNRNRFAGATCKCIRLSRHLVALNDETEIRQTMLHEIAHFLCGATHGHDSVWRNKAIEIGCDGKRLNSSAEMPKGRYVAKCSCGKVYYKHRKGKNTLKANWFRCKTCKQTVQFVDTLARF